MDRYGRDAVDARAALTVHAAIDVHRPIVPAPSGDERAAAEHRERIRAAAVVQVAYGDEAGNASSTLASRSRGIRVADRRGGA